MKALESREARRQRRRRKSPNNRCEREERTSKKCLLYSPPQRTLPTAAAVTYRYSSFHRGCLRCHRQNRQVIRYFSAVSLTTFDIPLSRPASEASLMFSASFLAILCDSLGIVLGWFWLGREGAALLMPTGAERLFVSAVTRPSMPNHFLSLG